MEAAVDHSTTFHQPFQVQKTNRKNDLNDVKVCWKIAYEASLV